MSEFDPTVRNRANVTREAEDNGCVLLEPLDNELTLDIDRPIRADRPPSSKYVRVMECLKRNGVTVKSVLRTRSKSGNVHFWIKTEETWDPTQRVALQAAMGSDSVRETLSLLRIINEAEVATALFETPDQAQKVFDWRRSR